MDALDLKVFEAVADCGGMNKAAERLNTVQSNITQRIKRLEEELGVVLFERHSRGVDLTAAGMRLMPYAREVQAVLAEAVQAARDNGSPSGPLVLGSLETTAALRLSPHLSAYAAKHPEVDFTLRTGTTCELIDMVLNRAVEGALVCGPVNHPELAEDTVFHEDLAVMTHPDISDLSEILAQPQLRMVVLRVGCSYRQRLEEILTRRGIVGLRVLEFGTLEAIVGCVSAGLGITMLPRALMGNVWQEGKVRIHDLPTTETAVETVFIQRHDSHTSSALQAFIETIRDDHNAVAAE